MIMLSFGQGNVAAHLSGEPRFDQSLVDWLKGKPYPVLDTRDVFATDYQKCRLGVDRYLAPFYNGHHTPRGNFFTAWALKDTVVHWLNPRPLPYRCAITLPKTPSDSGRNKDRLTDRET